MGTNPMYVPFQDATALPVSFDAGAYAHGDISLPRVDAVAARDGSGKLWLALVNVDPNREVKVSAAVTGVKAASARGQILTAAAVDAHNSFDRPSDVAPKVFSGRASGGQLQFDLPPKSIAVVEVR